QGVRRLSLADQARAGAQEAGQAAARRGLMSLRIVFAGTPDFAVPSLRAAAASGEVVAVYTQPDRPAGRGRQPTPSPVKREALAMGLPGSHPENSAPQGARQAPPPRQRARRSVGAYGLL